MLVDLDAQSGVLFLFFGNLVSRYLVSARDRVYKSDKRQWLDKVHQQCKDYSLTIDIQTIDFLIEQGIPVTYHNISEHSKAFDVKGSGIHQNTIKLNEKLHSYYQKHRH